MNHLIERSWAQTRAFEEFAELPQPCTVETRADGPDPGVRMQLVQFADLVAWAIRFDRPVVFTERTTYVNVSVSFAVHEVLMLAWFHMNHSEAFHLLQRWGYDLTPEGVSINASHAFALNSALATAS